MRKFRYSFVTERDTMTGHGTFLISSDGTKTRYSNAKPESTIQLLNRLGGEGWEIAGVSYAQFKPGGETMWTLKKPLED